MWCMDRYVKTPMQYVPHALAGPQKLPMRRGTLVRQMNRKLLQAIMAGHTKDTE